MSLPVSDDGGGAKLRKSRPRNSKSRRTDSQLDSGSPTVDKSSVMEVIDPQYYCSKHKSSKRGANFCADCTQNKYNHLVYAKQLEVVASLRQQLKQLQRDHNYYKAMLGFSVFIWLLLISHVLVGFP